MQSLAVVPIFVSAGAAVMPTVVAALASVVAILLKPSELLGLIRRRPMAALSTVAALVLVVAGSILWLKSGEVAKAAAREPAVGTGPTARTDWEQVAKAILDRQRVEGLKPTVFAAVSAEKSDNAAPMLEGRNVARNSWDGKETPTLSADGKLGQAWVYNPDGGVFLSAPLVAGDRVYVAASQQGLGGYSGLLVCLNKETGKPWYEIDTVDDNPLPAFFSSPALTADGKHLIIGQGLHMDADCSLTCFDAATGKKEWSVKTPLHIESSPALFGDVAVVGAGAIEGPDGKAMGDPGFVFGVSISTGKQIWKQAVNDPESSPVIDDNGIAYIGSGFNGEAVVALRTEADLKGQPRVVWKTPTGLPITSALTIVGDMVVTGGGNSDAVHSAANAQGVVLALDRKTGAIQWKANFADAVLGPIASHDDLLICGCRTGEVVALNAKDGSVKWHTPISGRAPILAGCAVTADRVYAVSSDGMLGILDLKDGKMIEKMKLNIKAGSGLSLSSPQVAGDRIYVGSETGGFKCLQRGK